MTDDRYSKVVTKISYGGYKLGANSANILVQDRLTGMINEERMSVYVSVNQKNNPFLAPYASILT